MRILEFATLLLPLLMTSLASSDFSDKIYDDLVYYAHYAKLSSCIEHNSLSEGYLSDGICDLRFCNSNPKSKKAKIIKVSIVPEDQSGTGFLVIDHENKEIIVSFRSSTTWTDWQADLTIGYSDYMPIYDYAPGIPPCEDNCKIHGGFYNHLEYITEELLKPVEDLYLKYPEYKLVLTGHSLGGAFAVIVGLEFRVRGLKPLVFAYGVPRLFDKGMKSWVNTIFETRETEERIRNGESLKWGLARVAHENDYVPHLPRRMKHAGVEFFITKRDLPHTKSSVEFLGTGEDESNMSINSISDLLHGYEHRTYFMTINKCLDDDEPEYLIKDHP